jgi:DNA-binding NarL/FixJ family response regulator
MSVKSYRVLVADDHPVVRHGVRVLLESQPDVQVRGEASTGMEAVDYVKK